MGLLVRPGTQSTIAVNPGQEAQIRLAWGHADGPAPAQEFVVPACEGEEDFLIYSGGLWVSEPACVALTVGARNLTEEIVIPVATDCP